jgi:hypothetical protein
VVVYREPAGESSLVKFCALIKRRSRDTATGGKEEEHFRWEEHAPTEER